MQKSARNFGVEALKINNSAVDLRFVCKRRTCAKGAVLFPLVRSVRLCLSAWKAKGQYRNFCYVCK